jgi:hypothetical protein
VAAALKRKREDLAFKRELGVDFSLIKTSKMQVGCLVNKERKNKGINANYKPDTIRSVLNMRREMHSFKQIGIKTGMSEQKASCLHRYWFNKSDSDDIKSHPKRNHVKHTEDVRSTIDAYIKDSFPC